MQLVQLYKYGETYGLFTYSGNENVKELVSLCYSKAQTLFENNAYDYEDLDDIFIEQLELEGVERVYVDCEIHVDLFS